MLSAPLCAQYAAADTTNILDEKGHRQGFWRLTASMTGDAGYKKNQVVEEGYYVDNKREGVWRKFYPSGTLKSEIEYINNHPGGRYRIYYPNGNTEEEGSWSKNKNTGSFNRFHENGNPSQEFIFTENGKRNGLQKYFHESGKVLMTVEVENGVAHGLQRIYSPEGDLIEEKRFINGQIDPESVVYAKKNAAASQAELSIPAGELKPATEDKPNLGEFRHNGFNALYNKNLQITQVGEFRDGKLWNGRWHRYDDNGILRKIELYKNGRFAGLGNLDEAN